MTFFFCFYNFFFYDFLYLGKTRMSLFKNYFVLTTCFLCKIVVFRLFLYHGKTKTKCRYCKTVLFLYVAFKLGPGYLLCSGQNCDESFCVTEICEKSYDIFSATKHHKNVTNNSVSNALILIIKAMGLI